MHIDRRSNHSQNRRVASRQTPYFFQRQKSKQKDWFSPSGGHIPSPGFGGFYEFLSMGSGPFQGGLPAVLS